MFAASGKGKVLGFSKVFQEEEDEDAPQLTRNGENGLSQDADENKYRKESRKLSTWMGLVVLGWLLSLFALVVVMDRRLPTALTIADLPVHPGREYPVSRLLSIRASQIELAEIRHVEESSGGSGSEALCPDLFMKKI